jgi:hypothetical protein
VPRSLDRDCQRALVPGAGAELAARLDLASLGDVTAQARGVLVVHLSDLVDAKSADFASPAKAATAAPARSTSATWATGAPPATRTAPTAGAVAPAGTLAQCTASEARPRRFALGSACAKSLTPLPGFVIAHVFLVFLVLVTDVRSWRFISVLERWLAIVPRDLFDRSGLLLLVRSTR